MFWRAGYRLLTTLLLPLVFGYFAWRGRREPDYRRHWAERLGRVGDVPVGAVWLHAASVGEVGLIAPLVAALAEADPHTPLLITTMTPTGRAGARARFGDRVHCRYLPLDTCAATRRFMRRLRPAVGVIAETELWPNLAAAAEEVAVPVVFVNASISTRSARGYARFPVSLAVRFILERVAAVGAASALHAQRFIALGARPAHVHVTGNLKYDVADQRAARAVGTALRAAWRAEDRPVWIAASTHDGEEDSVLAAFDRIRRRFPEALLVLAPRHPQRFAQVGGVLAGRGLRVARRSADDPVDEGTDIVYADTLGEVPRLIAASDVAFVGGSLVSGIGGHNVIEPAALARPVLVGPYIGEWQEIMDGLVDAGAGQVVADDEALAAAVGDWFQDFAAARRAGEAAAACVYGERGALARTLALIEQARAHPGAR